MNGTSNTIARTTIREIMSKEVIVVPTHATMAEAAQLLVENDISGAPVVDEVGHCVGVISATDYVQLEQNRESICSDGDFGTVHDLITDQSTGALQVEAHPFGEISRYMSRGVQTIARDATIPEAIQMLNSERINRLIVLDETERPEGVVTSHDLLALVAKCLEG